MVLFGLDVGLRSGITFVLVFCYMLDRLGVCLLSSLLFVFAFWVAILAIVFVLD